MPSAGQISFVHDQTRMRWMTSLTSGRFQPPLVLPEGDTIDFVFRWSNNGTLFTPSATPVWIFGIKDATTPSGDFLVQVNTASANAGVYTFTVPISSAELQTWLATATSQSYAAIQITDTANGIATTPLLCQITANQNDSGTTPTSANGTLNVAAGKTVTFPLTLTFPSAAGTNGQQLTLSNSTTGLLEWAASGGITDGDKGDITVTASGATWTIDAGVVTLAKLAHMATNRVIGRTSAGTGAPELLTISGTGSVAMTQDPVFTNLITAPYIACTTELQIGASANGISFIDDTESHIILVVPPAGVFGSNKTQTLQNASGTVALTSDITGGTLAGSFTTITGTSSATLGTNGGTGGSLVLRGSTSGSATINTSATGGLQLGTPTTLVLTNATGLPLATGISGLGSGVASALALATNAVGGMPTKLYEDWNSEEVTLYNSGTPTIDTAGGSTFVGVKYIDGASTYIQFPISAARWAGRTVKMKMLVLGNTTEASKNFRLRLALEWRTSALNGATTSVAGPGIGMDGGGEDNGGAYNYPNGSSVSLTADKLLEVTSVDSWTIPANATFISLFFGMERANAGDTYAGTLWSLLFMLQEQ